MEFPSACLYYLVTRTSLVTTNVLRRELAEGGVGAVRPAYLGVLWTLCKQEGLKSSELGRAAGLEPSSMTGLLDRMERDGLVRREPDPEDRRAQRLSLTDRGRRLEAAVTEVVSRVLDELTGDLEPEEIETVKRVLGRIISAGAGPAAGGGRNGGGR